MRKYFWQKDNVSLVTYTEKYKDFIDNEPDEEDICLMILNENEECVGHIVFNWLDERGGSTGIYVEVDEKYRRHGYGTSAMEIMLEYAFNERRLHKVQGASKSNEEGIGQFLFQLGFSYEATRSNMFVVDGKKVDEYYYGMTEEEYRDSEREKKHHTIAPADFMVPVSSCFGMPEDGRKYEFTYVDYERDNDHYYCNGLKFRGTTMEDCLINNEIIYDSRICRLFDDDVKMPGLTDVVDEFAVNHLNYKMEDDRLEFAIEEDGQYMGCVSLCGINKEHERVSASIYLQPECRGKGIGPRALQFAMSYAAKELGCTTFFTCVSAGNEASARMMYKVGLHLTGIQREAAFVGGKYVDTYFFEK